MNTRASLFVSLGTLAAVALGVAPGCGSDEKGTGAGLLDAGPDGASSLGDSSTPTVALVGSKCLQDTDCPKGLTCVTSLGDATLGDIPGGVCTADCSADIADPSGGTDTCGGIDRNSICVSFNRSGSIAYCLEDCMLGPVARGQKKCHNRPDMACQDAGNGDGSGYCSPTCRSDLDCDTGTVCDLSMGMCVSEASIVGTSPLGAKCDPKASTDTCKAGVCLRVSTTEAFCSGLCKLGETGCGEKDPNASALDAFCLYVSDQTADTGDVGFCGQLCDCDGDCLNPDLVCTPSPDALARATGRLGSCSTRTDSSGQVNDHLPCGDAGGKPDAGGGKPDAGGGKPDAGGGKPDAGGAIHDAASAG